MALLDQVHEQEGQVVEHVDAGEIVVELDAVEQDRAVAEQHDVGEVEVAVAVADAAGGAAAGPGAGRGGPAGPGSGASSSRTASAAKTAGTAASRSARLPCGDLAHGGEPALVRARRCRGVGGSHGVGQPVDQGVGQPGRGGDAVELGLGREAAHLEQPFDRLAGAVQGEARGLGGDGRTRR